LKQDKHTEELISALETADNPLTNEITQKTIEYQSVLDDPNDFAHVFRVAETLYKSSLLPPEIANHMGSIILLLDFAKRLGFPLLAIAPETYIVYGKPSISGKFAIALINNCPLFLDRVDWAWFDRDGNHTDGWVGGQSWGCIIFTRRSSDGKKIGLSLDWGIVEAEGWSKKNGSKWLTMPEQMFCYRTATFFIRRYAPELLLGLQTVDEAADIHGLDMGQILTRAPDIVTETVKSEARPQLDLQAAKEAAALKRRAKQAAKQDPADADIEKRRSQMVDAFAKLGRDEFDIERYIGKPAADADASDLDKLKHVYKNVFKKVEAEMATAAELGTKPADHVPDQGTDEMVDVQLEHSSGHITLRMPASVKDAAGAQLKKIGIHIACCPAGLPEMIDGSEIDTAEDIWPGLKNVLEELADS
jgi:hypothetical protein